MKNKQTIIQMELLKQNIDMIKVGIPFQKTLKGVKCRMAESQTLMSKGFRRSTYFFSRDSEC